MEPVIPALHTVGCCVGDILPAVCPPHLVALTLHQRNKFVFGFGVLHALVDGIYQPNLPALALGGGSVFPAAHAFLFHLFLRWRQNFQSMSKAYFITGQPVSLQVGGALMEFLPILEADAVDDQVAVQMAGVDVGGHQHLEIGKLPLGQFQTDGVCLLGRQVVCLRKGLDEVVVLPPVGFPIPLLGELHFREDGLGGAVPTGHQPPPLPQRFFLLLGVSQHTAQSATAPASIFDCGKGCHLRSPPAGAAGAVR